MKKRSTAQMLSYLVALSQFISGSDHHTSVQFNNRIDNCPNQVEFILYGHHGECSIVSFYDHESDLVCRGRVAAVITIVGDKEMSLESKLLALYEI